MKYSCSLCSYSSPRKRDIIRHFDRKVSCGVGEKELVENGLTFKCEYCDKIFSTGAIMSRHQKLYCRGIMQRKIEELEKLVGLEKRFQGPVGSKVNNYGSASLKNFNEQDLKVINKLIRESEHYLFEANLCKFIYFNDNYPENHNCYLSSSVKGNKHINIWSDGMWHIRDKKQTIDEIISEVRVIIQNYMDENGTQLTKTFDLYKEYLDRDSGKEKNEIEEDAKLMYENMEICLYDNRHAIKNRKR